MVAGRSARRSAVGILGAGARHPARSVPAIRLRPEAAIAPPAVGPTPRAADRRARTQPAPKRSHLRWSIGATGPRAGRGRRRLSRRPWSSCAANRPDGRVRVTVLDVGQGDAILVEGGRGGRLLVDGGPDPDRLLVALDARLPPWDRRIDLLVLTHPHEDHVAGLALLAGPLSGRPHLRARDDRARTGLPRLAGGPRSARAADRRGSRPATGSASTRSGSASCGPIAARCPANRPTAARRSTTCRSCCSARSDASASCSPATSRRRSTRPSSSRGLPRVDLLKIAHHGSRTSSTGPFLDARPAAGRDRLGRGREPVRPSDQGDPRARGGTRGARSSAPIGTAASRSPWTVSRSSTSGPTGPGPPSMLVRPVAGGDALPGLDGRRPSSTGVRLCDPRGRRLTARDRRTSARPAGPAAGRARIIGTMTVPDRRAAAALLPRARATALGAPPRPGRGRGRGLAGGPDRRARDAGRSVARRGRRPAPRCRQAAARRPTRPAPAPRRWVRGLAERARTPELARAVAGPPGHPPGRRGALSAWSAFASREERIVAYADKRAGQRLESMDGASASWARRYPGAWDPVTAGRVRGTRRASRGRRLPGGRRPADRGPPAGWTALRGACERAR